MSKHVALATILLFFSVGVTGSRGDEKAVRSAIESYVEAFNKKDADTIATLWSPKGTHTDRESGEKIQGREAIGADIATYFTAQPDARLSGQIDSIRFVHPEVAIVEGSSSVQSGDEEPVVSQFTAILAKQDGKWLIDSIEESDLAVAASPYEGLRELEWLVGSWVDEGDEARVETTIRWTANRAFLLRSYVAQGESDVAMQGTQVIGWDPRSLSIRSWSFHSDGSFGSGTWSKNGDDWLIQSNQTSANGDAASGTYVLTKVDDNSFTMQLIGHVVEGEPQPTKSAVKIVRVAEEGTVDSAKDAAE